MNKQGPISTYTSSFLCSLMVLSLYREAIKNQRPLFGGNEVPISMHRHQHMYILYYIFWYKCINQSSHIRMQLWFSNGFRPGLLELRRYLANQPTFELGINQFIFGLNALNGLKQILNPGTLIELDPCWQKRGIIFQLMNGFLSKSARGGTYKQRFAVSPREKGKFCYNHKKASKI